MQDDWFKHMLAQLEDLGTELALRAVKEGFDVLLAARSGTLTREDRLKWHENVHALYQQQEKRNNERPAR